MNRKLSLLFQKLRRLRKSDPNAESAADARSEESARPHRYASTSQIVPAPTTSTFPTPSSGPDLIVLCQPSATADSPDSDVSETEQGEQADDLGPFRSIPRGAIRERSFASPEVVRYMHTLDDAYVLDRLRVRGIIEGEDLDRASVRDQAVRKRIFDSAVTLFPDTYAVALQIACLNALDFQFCLLTVHYAVDITHAYIAKLQKQQRTLRGSSSSRRRRNHSSRSGESGMPVRVPDFILIAYSALVIASKYEEVDCLYVTDVVDVVKKYRYFADVFSEDIVRDVRRRMNENNVRKMEVNILQALDFQPVNRALPVWFVQEYFMRTDSLRTFQYTLTLYLLEATFYSSGIRDYSARAIANAAINIARRLLRQTEIAVEDKDCLLSLARVVEAVIQSDCNSHREKKLFRRERRCVQKRIGRLL